jgi:hypothetical protein
MPYTTNRTHRPSYSPSSDDENTLPQSLDTSMEALIKVRGDNLRTESCDRVWRLLDTIKLRTSKNSLSQENEALCRKLAEFLTTMTTTDTGQSKCQKTRNATPTGSDDEVQDIRA